MCGPAASACAARSACASRSASSGAAAERERRRGRRRRAAAPGCSACSAARSKRRARGDPAHDPVGADRAVPAAAAGAGEADVQAQPVAGALEAGQRADRVQLLVGQQRRQVAELAARRRAGPALDLGPRRRRRARPQLQAVGVRGVVVALPARRGAQVAAAPARAVGAGRDPDGDLVDPARGQRELARRDRQRELDDVVPAVEVQRRAAAPALDAQRHEEVRAARHPDVDLGLAPVAPGVEHVQMPVVVGELQLGGPGGHVAEM